MFYLLDKNKDTPDFGVPIPTETIVSLFAGRGEMVHASPLQYCITSGKPVWSGYVEMSRTGGKKTDVDVDEDEDFKHGTYACGISGWWFACLEEDVWYYARVKTPIIGEEPIPTEYSVEILLPECVNPTVVSWNMMLYIYRYGVAKAVIYAKGE